MITHIRELRQFELMYILQEKPDTHNTCASRASPRTLPTSNPHVATFHADPTELDGSY
jgi:hypothetical protein